MESKINKFNYICSIPNFSLRPEKTGEVIISPNFVVGSKERSEWCLHIYPNGEQEDSKEYVSVFLTLLMPDKAKVKLSLSILNDKEEKNNTHFNDRIIDLDKGRGYGSIEFVKKNYLLDKSNGLLVNDKLTILCETEIVELKCENHENSIPYDVFHVRQRDVNVVGYSYLYIIENFSLRLEKTGEKIISPTFGVGSKERSEWCLWVYPNGDEEESKEYVSVYLVLLKPDKAKARCSFSIIRDTEDNKIFCSNEATCEFDKNNEDNRRGFPKFVRREILLNESNGLLRNGHLTIVCQAKITDLKTENHSNLEIIDPKIENRNYPETLMNNSIPQSKLSLDYGNLYDSSSFYDCVIKVEDREIKVLKAILAARSPVFHEIFTSTSDNSLTNIIEIKDFNVEVVEKMLIYIYTDKVSDIQNMADQMFEIANKYELDKLKSISEQSMCNSLTTDNVLKRFALSDKYPTERLKECCEELILKNMNHLKETKEWDKHIVVRPLLLQSLLFKLFSISSKENNSEKKDKE
uniref:Speckle-type POZ protein-like (inferred by orthology to a human protein) n=1 Tax=Strongyloides venezuelensis TaxID=75913 RepID=A0A0K0EVZ5_STRVS